MGKDMSAKEPLHGFTADDKWVLVKIVKAAQIVGIKGSKGPWKEFLGDRYLSDPALQQWDVLASFVQTFTDEDDIQMVKRFRAWKKWIVMHKLLDETDPWPRSPEQRLVSLTSQHPRFGSAYSFPSYGKDWVRTKRGASSLAKTPERMLSLDCEMVDCENGEKQVVQVCIVDRDCKTLVNTLVKPSKRVVNYLTPIHGISAADLEKATCTQEEIQRKIKKLLKPGTILIGHSLNYDLQELKIDYRRIIDTALIFKHHDKADAFFSPGLNDLCKAILGYEFRQDGKPHDCLEDAIVPMKIVLHELEHGPSGPLQIYKEPVLDKEKLCMLFLHKLPSVVCINDLEKVFPRRFPCKIQEIVRKRARLGTSYAIFGSKDAADGAFSSLVGELTKDSWGKAQKVVHIAVSSTLGKVGKLPICVRKMYNDSDLDSLENNDKEPQTTKRPCEILFEGNTEEDNQNMQKKKRTAAENDGECSCGHLEEIFRLKKLLEAKEHEIQNLQKLVVMCGGKLNTCNS